jgi:hypothetical protein
MRSFTIAVPGTKHDHRRNRQGRNIVAGKHGTRTASVARCLGSSLAGRVVADHRVAYQGHSRHAVAGAPSAVAALLPRLPWLRPLRRLAGRGSGVLADVC